MALFGDRRLEKKRAQLESAISASQSVVVQQLARSWAEQMSYYRLLHHPALTVEALLEHVGKSFTP